MDPPASRPAQISSLCVTTVWGHVKDGCAAVPCLFSPTTREAITGVLNPKLCVHSGESMPWSPALCHSSAAEPRSTVWLLCRSMCESAELQGCVWGQTKTLSEPISNAIQMAQAAQSFRSQVDAEVASGLDSASAWPLSCTSRSSKGSKKSSANHA